MEQVNLQLLSLVELKALAYDFISHKEDALRNLNLVNQEISLRFKKEQEKLEENAPRLRSVPLDVQ